MRTGFVFFFLLIAFVGQTRLMAQSSLGEEYFHKGDTFLLFNKHDSSIIFFKKAREVFVAESNWRRIVQCDNKLSENLSEVFKLKEAMKLAEEAYAMAGEYLGEFDLERATALNNIGNIHYLTGQHELALSEYQKAVKLTEAVEHDEKHLFAAPTSLGIGNVYFGKNQYEEAFKHFNQALTVNREILGENHPYVANSYLSLGNLYRNKGSYNKATEYYERALKINLAAFGENHPDVATTYVGIADIYKNSGSYDLAMQYYRQALVIYNKFLHEKNPKFGTIFLGYADVFKNKGNYDQALEYYQKALNLFGETIGLEHQNSVRSYLGVGNTYMYQEKFKDALDYYNKVMDINFNLVGENHVNSSAANNNLGSIYYFFGDYDLAIRYFDKALNIDKKIHGTEHPNVANAYYNLARVYGEKGQIRIALENCQAAINASIVGFSDKNIFTNPVLVNFFDNKDLLWYLRFKGELLEEGFRRSQNVKGLDISLNSFILSDSLVEQIRQSYTDRRDQVELSGLASKIYESSVNASYSLINLVSPENVKFIGRDATYEKKKAEYENNFFFFTEKDKGSILFSSLAESNAKAFGGIPDTLLFREKELKDIINSYTQELAANPDSSQLEFYQRELFKANREYEQLIISFETDYPKYFDLKYDVEVTDLKEVQGFLNDSTMMISYYIATDSIYVSYINNEKLDIVKVYKSEDYEKAIKAVRKGVLFRSDRIYAKYAREVYKQLFPKAIPEKIKNIIIVQDGIMATIPFEILLTEEVSGRKLDYQNLPYLINDYNISYTFSANLLYKTFRNKKLVRPKAPKDGIAIAPVEFDLSALDALREAKKKSYDEADRAKNLRKGLSVTPEEIKALPGTEEEISQISKSFEAQGRGLDKFTHYEAKEEIVKSGVLDDYKYVHIASHGFVNQEEPEFSGIFLNRDTVTKSQDGILFSGELYNTNLNAELVSLSACETGLGKISTGEGIIGLTRALIYAGAKNITVSLWKVSDESTKRIMIDYYNDFLSYDVPTNKFESLSYAYSLRKAKLDLIKTEDGKFAHPYYWSPFVLIGK